MSVKLKEDILKMRFDEVYGHFKAKELSCEEAAMILGMSVRTFLRKRERSEGDGFDRTFDRRLGKKSNNRCEAKEIVFLTKLYERYRGFSVKHFYGFYRIHPEAQRSYNWCRLRLQEAGMIEKGIVRGGKHRLRRERKPMPGMMLHQDGSTHEWIPGFGRDLDLIATLDDATSTITSAFLVEEEGTMSSFAGIKETVEAHGLFCSFYTDRGTHYWYTPEAGGKVCKRQLTQVGRALKRLGIGHIAAYSPQARGRSERMFGTLQGRLPKELAFHGITTMEDANRYIKDVYLPAHNKEFSEKASSPKTAYVPWGHKESLNEILCEIHDRVVQKDNTVRYETRILQIPAQDTRYHYVKAQVEVRAYLDGTLAVFYGPLCLGRYDQSGGLMANLKDDRQAA